ncbi:MAG TPA: hypothetical protein VHC22_29620 [Pirellulales bacterium]|nr:hypothetical protein [Pirellulales bacterium]
MRWLKALALLFAIAGIAGAGHVAYQAAAATPVNHRAIAQELERYFAEVQESRQTDLDYVAAAILKGRLRAQINSLRLPLRNSAPGGVEAILEAAANSVSTMVEDLALAKSPAADQAFTQNADEFQRLIAQAKQSISGT